VLEDGIGLLHDRADHKAYDLDEFDAFPAEISRGHR